LIDVGEKIINRFFINGGREKFGSFGSDMGLEKFEVGIEKFRKIIVIFWYNFLNKERSFIQEGRISFFEKRRDIVDVIGSKDKFEIFNILFSVVVVSVIMLSCVSNTYPGCLNLEYNTVINLIATLTID
jgi:hypothetical protein